MLSNIERRIALAVGLAGAFLLACLIGFGTSSATADESRNKVLQDYVGINGAPCAYASVLDALIYTSDGDTIYVSDVSNTTHQGWIGPIDHDVTIVAATNNCQTESTTEAVIDGQGASWAASGGLAVVRPSTTVTFTRIHLQNAHASLNGGIVQVEEDSTLILDSSQVISGTAGQRGGGINVEAGGFLAMLNGSVVYRNEVTGTFGEGGGVGVYSGTIYLERSRIGEVGTGDGNVSANDAGGAYLNESTLVISDSYVLNNIAVARGGGVMAVTDSSIFLFGDSAIGGYYHDYLGNYADDGGGVYLDFGSDLYMGGDSRLGFNSALNNGGGIYATANSTVQMGESSSLYSNTATFGGGAFITGQNTFFDVVSGSVRIEGNEAIAPIGGTVANGGGILATGGADLYAEQAQFVDNVADLLGGAIFVAQDGATDATTVLLYGGTDVSRNYAQYGGGLYIAHDSSDVLIDNSQIRSNAAITTGGGIRLAGNSQLLVVNNSIISNNVTYYSDGGGGLAMNDGRALVSDALFQNNRAGAIDPTNANGGAIHQSGGVLTVTNAFLIENEAYRGGGLYLVQSTAALTNVRVISNTANTIGGGIYLDDSDLRMGASFGPDCSPGTLPDHTYCSEIRGNDTANYGAGMFIETGPSTVEIADTAFLSNYASIIGTADGEALIVGDGTAMTVTNGLFTGHGLTDNSAVHVDSNATYFSDNSTYAGNDNVPIFVDSQGTAILTLNIIWDNGLPADIQGALTSRCNDTQVLLGGVGDTSINPRFINLRGPYRLGPGSPAIDTCAGFADHDLDGKSRPYNAVGGVSLFEHDMGAFEARSPVFIPLVMRDA